MMIDKIGQLRNILSSIADDYYRLASRSMDLENFRPYFSEHLNHLNKRIDGIEKKVRGLKSTAEEETNKSYQAILTSLLRNIRTIEEDIKLSIEYASRYTHLWSAQRCDTVFRYPHIALDHFITGTLSLLGIDSNEFTIPVFFDEPGCSPNLYLPDLAGNKCCHAIWLPSTARKTLCSWVLLSHEVGHIYYDHMKGKIGLAYQPIEDSIGNLIRTMDADKGAGLKAKMEDAWENWLPELFSDFVAVKCMGLAYIQESMTHWFDHELYSFDLELTHPPNGYRLEFMIKTLESIPDMSDNAIMLRDHWTREISAIVLKKDLQYDTFADVRAIPRLIEVFEQGAVKTSPVMQVVGNIRGLKERVTGRFIQDISHIDVLSLVYLNGIRDPFSSLYSDLEAIKQEARLS